MRYAGLQQRLEVNLHARLSPRFNEPQNHFIEDVVGIRAQNIVKECHEALVEPTHAVSNDAATSLSRRRCRGGNIAFFRLRPADITDRRYGRPQQCNG